MIEMRVFGSCVLECHDRTEASGLLTQPKRFALLVYLALATPHGYHRRDRLLAIFWPQLDAPRARAALRKAVHVIRQTVGESSIASRGDEELAIADGVLQCDALEFEKAIEAGRPARALELYRGDLLDGFFAGDAIDFEQWLDETRGRYRQQAATAAWIVAQRHESDSQTTLAVDAARRAATLAPLDERVVRKVIAMFDRAGDRAGAIALYQSFRTRLGRELGVEPAPETEALVAAVRRRGSTNR